MLDLAATLDADVALALALDPDADRLAVTLPVPADERPTMREDRAGWCVLGGDDVGALLAEHLLTSTSGNDRPVASTIVSSRLVGSMCAAAGVRHAETLTGFKWLSRPGLQHPGWHQLPLYEEALGTRSVPVRETRTASPLRSACWPPSLGGVRRIALRGTCWTRWRDATGRTSNATDRCGGQ